MTVFLTDVKALIKLANSNVINIKSDFGKYNIDNYDTIFSKNVVYNNTENVLKADVIEININTKDTKIFMYEKNNKVNIKSKN